VRVIRVTETLADYFWILVKPLVISVCRGSG